jgi:hypothetical protein
MEQGRVNREVVNYSKQIKKRIFNLFAEINGSRTWQ